MRKNLWLLSLMLLLACNSSTKNENESDGTNEKPSFSVTIKNPLAEARSGTLVVIQEAQLPGDFNKKAFSVWDGETEIPSQYNTNGETGLAFVIDSLKANDTKEFTIQYNIEGEQEHNYPKRTQAELSIKKGGEFKNREYIGGEFENVDSLRVPDEHTDHSWFIRYEGPGWESDLVGYRFYLDWRNGVDVFGKTGHNMELQHVGMDGFDSYHEWDEWGMDVLKVGESLGVGSIATFYDNKAMRVAETDSVISKILENGPVYSAIQTDYFGWKVAGNDLDLESVISIHADTRLSRQHLELEKDLDNIATGLNKDKKAKLFTSEGDSDHWGYIATYGDQSLNDDNLGIAVLFAPDNFTSFKEDDHSHVVTLKPQSGKVDYYLLAAWEKEPNGIKTQDEFITYLERMANELAHPVQITVNK